MSEQGITIAETVRRMGEHLPGGESISRASISQYRTGRAIPRAQYMEALSLALGVEKSELIAVPNSPLSPLEDCAHLQAHCEPQDSLAAAPMLSCTVAPHPDEAADKVGIRDLGTGVHLKIDQRVTWDVALIILGALKGSQGHK